MIGTATNIAKSTGHVGIVPALPGSQISLAAHIDLRSGINTDCRSSYIQLPLSCSCCAIVGKNTLVRQSDAAGYLQGVLERQAALVHRQIPRNRESTGYVQGTVGESQVFRQIEIAIDRKLRVGQHHVTFSGVAAAHGNNRPTLHINRVVVAARNCCCVAGAYATVVDYHVGFGLGIILQV
ncbi:MAG: hypothetical protein WC560_13170, partial [Syntrophales bacterium]